MARIRISDHEKFTGDYRAVQQNDMRIGTQMELQYQAGWSNAEMREHLEQAGTATVVVIFATLWQNGKQPTWDEVCDLTNAQIRYVREASDPKDEDDDAGEVTDADPTPAPRVSSRGDDELPSDDSSPQ